MDPSGGAGHRVATYAPQSQPPSKRARAENKTMGVMLTFNGSFLHDAPDSAVVFEEFREFVFSAMTSYIFERWSATMELSLKSNRTVTLAEVFGSDSVTLAEGVQRAHLHLFRTSLWSSVSCSLCSHSRVPFRICIAPTRKVVVCARAWIAATSACGQNKMGSLHFKGNYFPWTEWAPDGRGKYRVEGRWIDDFWNEHKLANAIYIKYAELIRVDFPKRRTWHDAIVSQLLGRKLEAEVSQKGGTGQKFWAFPCLPRGHGLASSLPGDPQSS